MANLYDPYNPIREKYLRCKYQVYVNRRMKQEFAESISKSIEALNGLKAKRDTVESNIKSDLNSRF